MILRSIVIVSILSLLFSTGVLSDGQLFPNILPNRWKFPTFLQYTAIMKEEVLLTHLSTTLSMTITDDNTPLIFFDQWDMGARWECGVELGSGKNFQVISAKIEGKNTNKLVLTSSLPSPTTVSRFIVSCKEAAMSHPEEPFTPNEATHTMFTIHVTDTELGTVHTDDLEVTIFDIPSISHTYSWGGEFEWSSSEIMVDFQVYRPSSMSHEIKDIYFRHPLLNINTITSMHIPPTANRLEDLGRPYHVIQLEGFPHSLPCRTAAREICATISFEKISRIQEFIPRASFTNAEGEPCVCKFSIPYPPDVLQYMLHQSQNPHVSLLKRAPSDSVEPFVELVSIPMQEPRIIPAKTIMDQTDVYIWHSGMHSHANMLEFELGIAVSNQSRSFQQFKRPADRIQFRVRDFGSSGASGGHQNTLSLSGGDSGDDDEDVFAHAEGSPVMACRPHDTLDYPEDIPIVNGTIDITTGEFNRFGKTCRFRFLNTQPNIRSVWYLSPILIMDSPSDAEPDTVLHHITLFSPMHHAETIRKTNLFKFLQLHDVAVINPNKPLSHQLQPIVFTSYTRTGGNRDGRFATATIDIKPLLPYDIRLGASGLQLAMIFPNQRNFDHAMPAIPRFTLIMRRNGGNVEEKLIGYQDIYNFSMLQPDHRDPIESIFQTGRPLRAPMVALFDHASYGLLFEKGKTIEITLEFQIKNDFDVEHEPIYLALLSPLDLRTGTITPQYAKITPAGGNSKRTLGIVLGCLFSLAALTGLAVGIICCQRNSMACFQKSQYEDEYNYDSELDTQLPS